MKDDDTTLFKRDYLPLQPVMQRMAESLLGSEEDAADVVQDCFVILWKDRAKLAHVKNREAWCITLVKRRCIDLMRRRSIAVPIDDLLPETSFPADDDRLELARRLIAQLPERQAQAVNLRHFDALDTSAIATEMHTTEGNVYTLLSRAYSSLKQMIKQYEKR